MRRTKWSANSTAILPSSEVSGLCFSRISSSRRFCSFSITAHFSTDCRSSHVGTRPAIANAWVENTPKHNRKRNVLIRVSHLESTQHFAVDKLFCQSIVFITPNDILCLTAVSLCEFLIGCPVRSLRLGVRYYEWSRLPVRTRRQVRRFVVEDLLE